MFSPFIVAVRQILAELDEFRVIVLSAGCRQFQIG